MLAMLVACALAPAWAQTPTANPVKVDRADDVTIVTVNLRDRRVLVDVSVAEGFPGTADTFDAHIKRTGAVAAINGAYFSRDNLYPIGDIVSNDEVLHQGRMGTALAVTADNEARVFRVTRHRTADWSPYRTVIACGPALVLDGQVDVDAAGEGFRDPAAMRPVPRQAVGVTADGRLLMVAMRRARTFEQAAAVMKRLGCVGALNLDSGASAALYANGRTLVAAGRRLPSVLVVRLRSS